MIKPITVREAETVLMQLFQQSKILQQFLKTGYQCYVNALFLQV